MLKFVASSLRYKILLMAGTGTLLLASAALYGIWQSYLSIEHFERVLSVNVANERAVLEVTSNFKKQVQEWKDTLLRGADPAKREKYWGKFQSEEKGVQAKTQQLVESVQEPKARALVADFLKAHTEMGKAYRRGFDAYVASGYESAAGDKAVAGIDRAPTRLLEQASAAIAGNVSASSIKAIATARQGITTSLGAMIAAVVVATLAFLFFIQRQIVGPAKTLEQDLSRLAGGDFSRPVSQTTHDELGYIADSAERLRRDVGGILDELSRSTSQLSAAAEQMHVVTEGTREGVQRQHRETDQVATAMNEMTATVREVARHAAEAASAAEEADGQAGDGRKTVAGTARDIESLAGEIERTAEVIQRLDGESANIGGVLEVIRGIAEQTNLLALNAAIEAARAGEQGRGFAVVADEVRTLASRTQQSTEEIRSMIERLQAGAQEAVNAMEGSREMAKANVEHAAQAMSALEAIAASVARINDMNLQIASAAEEQGAVAEEINANINTISEIAETSAQGSEQMAQAGGELSSLAQTLQGIVQRFRL